eukprot:TRINITY_DN3508_c0_g1_i1.p1 TRINITY_DN3508_c0_g1~~TRINITY_DN3508_c0_g1_i1.p1  ORF type:complete len:1538 (+),score=302.45 TRINITY_DN3508_c0_g1_i1:61-4674(+)
MCIYLYVLGAYRGIILFFTETIVLPYHKLYVSKFMLNIVLALLPIVRSLVRALREELYYYQIIGDTFMAVAWLFSSFLLMMEYHRGMPESWVQRSWWLIVYVVSSVKLQTVVTYMEYDVILWDDWLFFVQYILQAVIAILGLWFNLMPYSTISADEAAKFSAKAKTASYGALTSSSTEKPGPPPSPEATANIFSRYTFWWMNDLLHYGYANALVDDDLWDLSPVDKTEVASQKFTEAWNSEVAGGSPSFPRAMIKAFGWPFMFAGVYKLANDLLTFAGPVLLGLIVTFVQDGNQPFYYGLIYVAAMFITSNMLSVAQHQYFHIGFRVGMWIRGAIVTAVYRKAFRLSSSARQGSTTGEIVNLMALDAQRFMDLMPYLHMIWSSFLQITICLVLLWRVVGVATLAGLVVMVVFVPINLWLARVQTALQKGMMGKKDERNKIVNEVLQGIRVIKFFAWEINFVEKVTGIRNAELEVLKKGAYLRAITLFLWSSTPLFVSVATFCVFALLGNVLTAEIAFTALALFNVLRFPLNMLPMVVQSLVESWVSAKRLQAFLLGEELDPAAVERVDGDIVIKGREHYEETVGKGKRKFSSNHLAVRIKDGQFGWNVSTPPTLKNINIEVPRGALLAIVGGVGSGKSALLSALLGDICKLGGKVQLSGSLALVTQQPWIQNATLRENIIYGTPFDQAKYDRVVRVCELTQDIAMLPAGDRTEIGEKGINLSGGQKQRVSIARAVYAQSDIYLFDDPLSAVDAHVGKAIFDNCIVKELASKTRILVTHQLQHLSGVDYIIVLNDGEIVETGTYKELMKARKQFATLIETHVKNASSDEEEEESDEESSVAHEPGQLKKSTGGKDGDAAKKAAAKPAAKIMTVEERDVGSVSWHVYYDYVIAVGGIFLVGLIVGLYGLDQSLQVGSSWWLSYWSTQSEDHPENPRTLHYMGIYAALGMGAAFIVLVRSFVFAYGSINSARVLHERLLKTLVRAPMAFFDTTPIGRILNRFSKDIYTVDEMLPRSMGMFLNTTFSAIGIVVVISMVTPIFLCALIPLGYIYHYMQQYYVRSSRELKRLDSISKSPIFAHFSETLSGVTVIRSFDKADVFIKTNEKKLDLNQRAYFASVVSNRWLGVRIEFIGTCVVTLAALFAVMERENIDPGMAGLSLTYALNVTSTLNWLVRMATELETQLVSVERVLQYVELETEAPPYIESTEPPSTWPAKGAITLANLSLRYRPELDFVLRNVSCTIKGREKVGVVGRTGAGKSSLMLGLFRLVEAAEGSVRIDGVDISRIGLDTLRSRLSIIPQDPTLFTGTIRSNMDPFNLYSDGQIWEVLDKVHLAKMVRALPAQLDGPVSEFGENLSVGQRQLMCLGRAILRHAKILVMDEATAAVDFETDSLIQRTIAEEFADTTVLTIAHRINTIIDYDRVMVLDRGRIAEFDTPAALLEDPSSQFYSMVNASGVSTVDDAKDSSSSATNKQATTAPASGSTAAGALPPTSFTSDDTPSRASDHHRHKNNNNNNNKKQKHKGTSSSSSSSSSSDNDLM